MTPPTNEERERLEAAERERDGWSKSAREVGERCYAAEAERDRLREALVVVIDHVEEAFPGGTRVDPVFVLARAALADQEGPPANTSENNGATGFPGIPFEPVADREE